MFVEFLVIGITAALIIALSAVVARQRHMLRTPGSIPLATKRGSHRWLYGVGQYAGGELRWYRALGIGRRPSRIVRRGEVRVVGTRRPQPPELSSVASSSIIVNLRDSAGEVTMAFPDGAYTGFVSWLESSAPRS